MTVTRLLFEFYSSASIFGSQVLPILCLNQVLKSWNIFFEDFTKNVSTA